MNLIQGLLPVRVELRARLRPHRQRHLQCGSHDGAFLQAPLGHIGRHRTHESLVHIDESLVEADRYPLLQVRVEGVVLHGVPGGRTHLRMRSVGRLAKRRLLLGAAHGGHRQVGERGARPLDGVQIGASALNLAIDNAVSHTGARQLHHDVGRARQQGQPHHVVDHGGLTPPRPSRRQTRSRWHRLAATTPGTRTSVTDERFIHFRHPLDCHR